MLNTVGDTSTASGSGYANRLFQVLECILGDGPIDLGTLSSKSKIPKTTVWRICKSLQAQGWVRSRIIDGCYEATTQLDLLLMNGHVARPETDEIDHLHTQIKAFPDVSAEFGMLEKYGRYKRIDGDDSESLSAYDLSLAFGLGPTAALIAETDSNFHRHIEMFKSFASEEERRFILDKARMAELLRLRASGPQAIWSDDSMTVAIPWKYKSGASGAIVFSSRLTAKQSLKKTKEQLNKTMSHFSSVRVAETTLWEKA